MIALLPPFFGDDDDEVLQELDERILRVEERAILERLHDTIRHSEQQQQQTPTAAAIAKNSNRSSHDAMECEDAFDSLMEMVDCDEDDDPTKTMKNASVLLQQQQPDHDQYRLIPFRGMVSGRKRPRLLLWNDDDTGTRRQTRTIQAKAMPKPICRRTKKKEIKEEPRVTVTKLVPHAWMRYDHIHSNDDTDGATAVQHANNVVDDVRNQYNNIHPNVCQDIVRAILWPHHHQQQSQLHENHSPHQQRKDDNGCSFMANRISSSSSTTANNKQENAKSSLAVSWESASPNAVRWVVTGPQSIVVSSRVLLQALTAGDGDWSALVRQHGLDLWGTAADDSIDQTAAAEIATTHDNTTTTNNETTDMSYIQVSLRVPRTWHPRNNTQGCHSEQWIAAARSSGNPTTMARAMGLRVQWASANPTSSRVTVTGYRPTVQAYLQALCRDRMIQQQQQQQHREPHV